MKNVIIAYSLNPEIIVKEFEQKTPTLKKELILLILYKNLDGKLA